MNKGIKELHLLTCFQDKGGLIQIPRSKNTKLISEIAWVTITCNNFILLSSKKVKDSNKKKDLNHKVSMVLQTITLVIKLLNRKSFKNYNKLSKEE